MTLTREQQALLPGPEEAAFFHQHGWWIAPPCLEDELLDELEYGLERYYAGERDTPILFQLGTDWTAADGNVLRQNDYLSMQMDEYRAFVRHPLLPAMAAALAGTPAIRLFHDQIVYKPAGAPGPQTVVGWHTDKAYWRSCTSTSMLTAWIPFRDVDEASGTMMVIDGSHTWPGAEELHTFKETDLAALEARISRGGELRRVPMAMQRGQVSFHHCLAIHGSHPNRADRPRIAYAIHYQDEANAYRTEPQPDGRLATHINDALCRRTPGGYPDYADPNVCPRLWPE
jgi:ectoine hydroxylase-related dioxygenase (phytanoyl-CoA dioxygenase family)